MRGTTLAILTVVATLALASCAGGEPATSGPGSAASARPGRTTGTLPPIRHVFVINLENQGFTRTWGPDSPVPYLSGTLRARGALLTHYYAIGHFSLPNYLAQISGQGPNGVTQGDCKRFAPFVGEQIAAPGQLVGYGCVYPPQIKTVADQLHAAGLTWKAYQQGMGVPCRRPALGARDTTQKARPGDEYAARHNPFVYFRSLTDTGQCQANDVDLSALPGDLRAEATTPNLAYLTPDLCHDGHDQRCVDGSPGGMPAADAWLRVWVPRILDSPAFRRDGLLLITFDEADSGDASACCGEGATPNTRLPGLHGPGGGRVGLLAISPFIKPGTTSARAYNHYSLLASVEDLFGLPRLGYAGAPGTTSFGVDVYTAANG